MSEYKYNAEERETIISTHDGMKTVHIYSYQRKYINLVIKLAESRPDDVKILKQTDNMIEAEMPTRFLKLKAPKVMTEEQRLAAIANFQKNKYEVSKIKKSEDDQISQESIITEAGAAVDDSKLRSNIYLQE